RLQTGSEERNVRRRKQARRIETGSDRKNQARKISQTKRITNGHAHLQTVQLRERGGANLLPQLRLEARSKRAAGGEVEAGGIGRGHAQTRETADQAGQRIFRRRRKETRQRDFVGAPRRRGDRGGASSATCADGFKERRFPRCAAAFARTRGCDAAASFPRVFDRRG